MRPFLNHNGAILPPLSRAHATERVRHLQLEKEKIKQQLDDPSRTDNPAWRYRARRKLGEFTNEIHQTEAWLAGYKAANDETDMLFREAYDLLAKLENEVDFEKDEEALMDRLDERMDKVQ